MANRFLDNGGWDFTLTSNSNLQEFKCNCGHNALLIGALQHDRETLVADNIDWALIATGMPSFVAALVTKPKPPAPEGTAG